MKRFQRILVGVDLTLEGDAVSVGSRRAAVQAQWLAEKTGATLTFLHSSWADVYEEDEAIRQGPSEAGQRALEELVAEYDGSGVTSALVHTRDRAWIEMIRRVKRGENDLVIVGRRNAVGGTTIGSVARKLMRKCPCPVWIVKPDAELVHRAVMAATDLTPVGDLAVELASYIAGTYGCDFHVVHAWQTPMELQIGAEVLPEDEVRDALDDIQRKAEEQILGVLRRVGAEARTQLHVGRDAPSRSIRDGVERLDVDLLVMGTVSRGGVAGFLMGNTAERLLDRVSCSLLTIKPHDFISPVEGE